MRERRRNLASVKAEWPGRPSDVLKALRALALLHSGYTGWREDRPEEAFGRDPVRLRIASAVFLLCGIPLFAQSSAIPQISAGGIVGAASWSSFVAPGSIVAIFGSNLAAGSTSASAPFPLTLGGASVTVNGLRAPLLFVSPSQINAQLPSTLAIASGTVGTASVVVTSAAGASAPTNLYLTLTDPAFFTADGSGCGEAAALNIKPDGTVSVNSSVNSAAPGDYITLFGTGFGLSRTQPADGTATAGAAILLAEPELFVDKSSVPLLPSYAGLAPGLPGVDQINFQVPVTTRNGCAVPVAASQTLGSPLISVAVQSGRGQCIDPAIQSYGQISLNKNFFSSSPSNSEESFSATFLSGPAVTLPASETVAYAPSWVANVSIPEPVSLSFALLVAAPLVFPSCQVPGYSLLSAGAIQIQPPSGAAVTAQPLLQSGVGYVQNLTSGFIGPGTYAVSGTPGSPVTLNTSLTVGSPITITTSFPSGTSISSSQPLTISWTGGDSTSLVRVALISGQGPSEAESYSYAHATDGSLTFDPQCSGASVGSGGNDAACSFGLPLSSTAQIAVSVRPEQVQTISMPGVTGPVQLTWQYSYNFSGLTLTN